MTRSDLSKGMEELDYVSAARVEAQHYVYKLQHETLKERLTKIEEMLERLEKRLWLAVYGVVAVVLAEAVIPMLNVAH